MELDTRLIPILKELMAPYPNVEIIHGDILSLDVAALIQRHTLYENVKVVANLPYYITTPIIMDLLEKGYPLASITVMMQREVADRLKAAPGTKDYGALTLAVQYYAQPYLVANVPQNCFMPRPGVDSAVVRLTRLAQPRVQAKDPSILFGIIKAAFGQRRKTLVNGLSHQLGYPFSKEDWAHILASTGQPATIRGEALSLAEFAALADEVYDRLRAEEI